MGPVARAVAPIRISRDKKLRRTYDGHGSGADSSVQQTASRRFAQFRVGSKSCPCSKDHGRLLRQRGTC